MKKPAASSGWQAQTWGRRLLIATLSAVLLASCGQKGPLVKPTHKDTPATAPAATPTPAPAS